MMDKRGKAIERLKFGERMSHDMYGKPLLICYSGGKDSQVVLRLAIESGIDFEVQHSHTTVDAPETVRTVRRTFKALDDMGITAFVNYPETTMWRLIVKKKMPPTRLMRYCCAVLKEQNGRNRCIATGVRKSESKQRSNRGTVDVLAKRKENRIAYGDEIMLTNDDGDKRRELERCVPKNAVCVNPIVDWTDADVWEYYRSCEIKNPLYAEGQTRVGCIGCPMAGKHRQEEFARYPKYKRAYIRAFGKMLDARRAAGLETKWKTGDDVFHWWMEDGFDENQLAFDFDGLEG